MTVGELIKELEKFPKDTIIVKYMWCEGAGGYTDVENPYIDYAVPCGTNYESPHLNDHHIVGEAFDWQYKVVVI